MVKISTMVAFALGVILLAGSGWAVERAIKCEGPGCEHVMNSFQPRIGENHDGNYELSVGEPTMQVVHRWPEFSSTQLIIWFSVLGIASAFTVFILIAMVFRIVVSTNEVHIVQSGKRTVSYGKDQPAGNTYYKWPSWVPVIGVRTSVLPMSVFNVTLTGYAAYDKGRVPFSLDVMAFFRINESNIAAQRVRTIEELSKQLQGILQGAIRSILASEDIERILEGRAEFSVKFTEAVEEQLKAWGVTNVKNIELMDIRDDSGSEVIANIMEKKKSLIEKESRVAVADNKRAAEEAEIIARRAVAVQNQDAIQQVGERKAQADRSVGIATQKAQQDVKEEEKNTATKEMAITQVMTVRKAEIDKEATVVLAEADLRKAQLSAQAVEVEGKAKGEAEKAVLLAPVGAQIVLAKEIGQNKGYQEYLIGIRTVEKDQVVGTEQAKALARAEIKVIANSGDVVSGVSNVMQLFTPKGGTQIGGMVEALAQTPVGKQVLNALTGTKSESIVNDEDTRG